MQLRLAQLFFLVQKVHVWCFEAILIANNYTPGSSKGNICVLHTPKSNHKHSVSMVTTPTHCKQNNNYCTPFATISQNADCEHQENCSNFGTVGKLTI